MSYSAYLQAEGASDVKHEYLRGEVFAMAGGPPEHTALAVAISTELSIALRGRPCRVFGSDLRIRIEATDLTTYPDVAVVCDSLERSSLDPHAIVNPVLIVEVLSKSTEAYDRGEKFSHYRRLPSLREYLRVSSQRPLIESYARSERGTWELRDTSEGEVLTLASLPNVRLDPAVIFDDPLA